MTGVIAKFGYIETFDQLGSVSAQISDEQGTFVSWFDCQGLSGGPHLVGVQTLKNQDLERLAREGGGLP